MLIFWIVLLLASSVVSARAEEKYAALTEAILSAWKSADLVCLGEDHGRQDDSDLRIALVRHPKFTETVKLIVVEFANPTHQDILDRFILDGKEMSREELAIVWRDASGAEVWESPIYETFLRAVREVNLALPRERRVRVIGGDSPIDWQKITTAEELAPLLNRGGNIRKIISEQVLDKPVKALAVYGGGHCVKVGGGFPGELADKYPGRMWSVSGFTGEDGATEGQRAFALTDRPAYITVTGTKWATLPAKPMFPEAGDETLGDMVDAIVWYGDTSDIVVRADTADLKAKHGAELARRETLIQEAVEIYRKRMTLTPPKK